MKTYKKQLVASAVSFLFLFVCQVNSFAQGQGDGHRHGQQGEKMSIEDRAKQRTAHMTEKLELTTEQIAQVQEINLRYAKKTQTERKNNRGDREAMRTIMEAIHNDMKNELKGILTDEQFQKLDEMKMNKGGKRGRKRGAKRNQGEQ